MTVAPWAEQPAEGLMSCLAGNEEMSGTPENQATSNPITLRLLHF